MALVGRSEELDVLAESFADCVAGSGQVVVVSGPVGSGKTELLRTFGRQAVEAGGATFLNATASRVESTLPLGVISQLFSAAKLPRAQSDRATRLLEDGALVAMLYEPGSEDAARVAFPVLNGLTESLLDLAERAPLLIGVDDVHFADPASLQYLLHLVRRVSQANVLIVLNETIRIQQPYPDFRAELLSEPHCRQLSLKMLSRWGVAQLLDTRLNLAPTRQLAAAFYQVSGGNPMLLNALVLDSRPGDDQQAALVVGDTFSQAVLTCLYRTGDATLLRLARVIAVLGEPASLAVIAELLGLDAEVTTRAIGAATEMGLLQDGQFRHARVRTTVLDCMAAEERAALREYTARVLHQNGADVVAVARHAIAANRPDASWSVPVLREAAETALDDDDTALALDCCRLAERAGGDETERAAVKSVLARIHWRLDPSAADRTIADLVVAARAGHLSGRHGIALVNYLLWLGRSEEAVELLERFRVEADPSDIDTAVGLYLSGLRLCYAYPGLAERLRPTCVAPRAGIFGAAKWSPYLKVGRILEALLSGTIDEEVVVDAEYVLQSIRLDSMTLALSLTCLEALILADCLDSAAFWCDALLPEAETRHAPVWQALFSGMRSMISFRRGDLAAAERYARVSLSQMAPRSWGVLIGIPLSTLVLTTARTGTYENAVIHLNMRVPEVMFETRFGLHYLRARGRYYLSRGYWQTAILVFDACRDLAVRWGLDLPELVPWRSDTAEAYVGLGQVSQAQSLVRDQLNRMGPHNGRTRGISLRVLAAASDSARRPALLQRAVEVLRASGDALELADALADLGDAERANGEHSQTRPAIRGTHHHVNGELSDAELRVAALAARGHTNRQIARRLYVTVSTVEQHLTRVYRKLNVSRRTDLPPDLQTDLWDPA